MWVADMCLPVCGKIQAALAQRCAHPTFGYTMQPDEMWEAVAEWWLREHRSGFVVSNGPPNVEHGHPCLLRLRRDERRQHRARVLDRGEGVLVFTPLYGELQKAIVGSGARLVACELELSRGQYTIDFDALDRQIVSCDVHMVFFCSPHNPSGRVWEPGELDQLARMCARRNALLVSDEIWAAWVFAEQGRRHTPLAPIARANGCRCITLGAPTKTSNLAGPHASYLIFEDAGLRQQYLDVVSPAFLHFGSVFATTAMLAAYKQGGPWLNETKVLVKGNIDEFARILQERAPKISVVMPQATYLVWLDCCALHRRLQSSLFSLFRHHDALTYRCIIEDAKLVLSPGSDFDMANPTKFGQFMRINLAVPRDMAIEAAERLVSVVQRLNDEAARGCGD